MRRLWHFLPSGTVRTRHDHEAIDIDIYAWNFGFKQTNNSYEYDRLQLPQCTVSRAAILIWRSAKSRPDLQQTSIKTSCHLLNSWSQLEAMSNLRILCRDYPERAIALATSEYALVFQHGSPDQVAGPRSGGKDAPRCLVEFASISHLEADDYRILGYGHGTLGLITLDEEVFLCVVTRCSRAATVRPGETVSRIDNVDFCMLFYSCYISHSNCMQTALPTQATRVCLIMGLRRNIQLTTSTALLVLKAES